MRAIVILLLSTCFASSALAQAAPAAGAKDATTMPTMINGKYVVGYEGRGDYLKNAQHEKQSGANAQKAAVGTSLADEMAQEKNGKSAPAAPVGTAQQAAAVAQPAAAPTPATNNTEVKLRSDSALSSDSSKAKAAAAAAAPPAPPTAAPATPTATPGAPNYNPMVLVGGKIQH